ncbi:MAG: histidinolphosphatase [Chrysothrix sp. TS-e1954]|nr:MAG: histidinolphosphatase [Chrysothrix sp. TS-e1954]
MSVVAMTEHIPRGDADLYPSELQDGTGPTEQRRLYEDFVAEARRLQTEQEAKYRRGKQTSQVLVGMEVEWIRPAESTAIVQDLMRRHKLDFMVGSVHHVHTIPIDYDVDHYRQARMAAGGSDIDLFKAYFDAQYEMLSTLKPLVVGHFDLIRLFSDAPDESLRLKDNDSQIWKRICRNLERVKEYGGVLEVNSSALRKGLRQPYPRREICEEWLRLGGVFVMSDDSHGVDQVGTHYTQIRSFLRTLGLQELGYLEKGKAGSVLVNKLPWKAVDDHPFWSRIE